MAGGAKTKICASFILRQRALPRAATALASAPRLALRPVRSFTKARPEFCPRPPKLKPLTVRPVDRVLLDLGEWRSRFSITRASAPACCPAAAPRCVEQALILLGQEAGRHAPEERRQAGPQPDEGEHAGGADGP
jgi:hypothetical protein